MRHSLLAEEIAEEFNLKIHGNATRIINGASALDEQGVNDISWVKSASFLDKINVGCVLVHESLSLPQKKDVTYLITTENPKVVFSKILTTYFEKGHEYYLKNEVDKHRLNKEITIADYVFIGQNVTIGKGTVIYPHVSIEADTIIGENCIIKSQVSLGTEGLGFAFSSDKKTLVKFPQLGKVVMQNDVEIGPNSTIRRGALKDTIVRKGTKIGSLVNIGHNCDIGEHSILTCMNVTSGSSKIGKHCFMGVGSSIKNGVQLGENVTIGQGAVVTKSFGSNVTLVGMPAKVRYPNE